MQIRERDQAFVKSRLCSWLAGAVFAMGVLGGCSSGKGGLGTSRDRQDIGSRSDGGSRQLEKAGGGSESERLDLVRSVIPAKMKVTQVVVNDDPVLGGRREYSAVPLSDVLALMSSYPEASKPQVRADWGVSFIALDRYRATFPLAKIFERMPFLAFKENGLSNNQEWSLIPAKKEAATPAPFYLVWEGENDDQFEFPVPYQVAFITLQKLDKVFHGAVPSEADSRPGFRRYSYKCIMCHAINFVGGISQADLNVPNNYTELHTQAEFIQKLSRQAKGGNSCPLAGGENETNLRQIWQYLKDMSDQKICDDEISCSKKEPL